MGRASSVPFALSAWKGRYQILQFFEEEDTNGRGALPCLAATSVREWQRKKGRQRALLPVRAEWRDPKQKKLETYEQGPWKRGKSLIMYQALLRCLRASNLIPWTWHTLQTVHVHTDTLLHYRQINVCKLRHTADSR